MYIYTWVNSIELPYYAPGSTERIVRALPVLYVCAVGALRLYGFSAVVGGGCGAGIGGKEGGTWI